MNRRSFIRCGATGLLVLLSVLASAAGIVSMAGPGSRHYVASASSPITASLVATQTSCTAPCGVVFDATGTTHTDSGIDTFRSLAYSYDFGDASAGTWTYHGGNSDQNIDRGGALSAHVFETAGTFTVKLKVRDSSGNTDQTSTVITVADPDTTFSGTSTICISTGTDMTGCPSGASQLTNQTAWPTWTDNRRYLLRRGDNFQSMTGSQTLSGRTNITISAYGSGAQPIVDGINGSQSSPNTSIKWWDLDIRTQLSMQSGSYLLLGKSTLSKPSVSFAGETIFDGPELSSGDVEPVGCVIYMPSVSYPGADSPATIPGYGMYAHMGRLGAILGFDFNDELDFHPIRVWNAYKLVVQHSRLALDYSNSEGFDLFKLHSEGLEDHPSDGDHTGIAAAARYIIYSENEHGNGTEGVSAGATIEPQNDENAEGIEDVLISRNRNITNFGSDYRLGGRRISYRGNFFDGPGGSPNFNTNSHVASLPVEWRGPYNNDSDVTYADPD